MLRVMQHLESQLSRYAEAPFLTFLRDPVVDPRKKLAFAPHVAHFVLTFGDMCSLILREDPPTDRFQELVNANSREDEGHWRWFLTDLEKLGQDPLIRYSDAIRIIWGEGTVRTRMLSYQLCHLGLASDSIGKLVLVHAIEGAFQITVKDLEPAAQAFAAATGTPLTYMGGVHSNAEATHTLEDPGVRAATEAVVLEPKRVEELCGMIDKALQLFGAFSDEMLSLAAAAPAMIASPMALV